MKLTIIGGGPGGYTAAFAAAKLISIQTPMLKSPPAVSFIFFGAAAAALFVFTSVIFSKTPFTIFPLLI